MRRILPALMLLALASCEPGVQGPSTIFGTYKLKTINGASLPMTVKGTEYVEGEMNLYQGLTYSETVRSRASGQSTVATTTETGSFTLFGTSVTFRTSDGVTQRIASIDGYDLIFIVDGVTTIYRK